MTIWLDDARVEPGPLPLLGEGGEACVHDLGDGRALKLWKAAAPVDAERRLRAFPRGLPAAVIAPIAIARDARRGGAVVGYAMRKVAGDALYHVGEPGWRRAHGVSLARLTAAIVELGRAVAAIHAAGVVIGDFNDLNVLVDGDRVWLIDADSFQYGAWPCAMFSERFVDPRLCDPRAPAPLLIRPHDRDSDWFAFAAMALRSLIAVGPYGGVHSPADPAARVAPAMRARKGVSIYDAAVRAPKSALPFAVLPDELNHAFEQMFAKGARGAFPIALIERLRWLRCACGADHARASCPVCRTAVAVPAAIVRGTLRATRIDPSALRIGARADVWLDGAMLWRRTPLGAEPIGQVLAGHTRVWTGARMGVGFYRAGGWTVGFVFRPDRRGLDDRVALPPMRGQLVDAHAVVGDDRAWLSWREAFAGRDTITTTVIGAAGDVIATATWPATDAPAGLARGAVAIGAHLFAPTDAGIVRIEASADRIAVTRTFPDTAELVGTDDELFAGPRGLDVRKPDGTAYRLEL